jgi:hypothetical protein
MPVGGPIRPACLLSADSKRPNAVLWSHDAIFLQQQSSCQMNEKIRWTFTTTYHYISMSNIILTIYEYRTRRSGI